MLKHCAALSSAAKNTIHHQSHFVLHEEALELGGRYFLYLPLNTLEWQNVSARRVKFLLATLRRR